MSRVRHKSCTDNYASAAEYLLKARDQWRGRPVANNTRLVRRTDNEIALILHSTDVVTWYDTGAVEFNSGGWRTVTTKDRMNCQSRFQVSSHRMPGGESIWTVVVRSREQALERIVCDFYGVDEMWGHWDDRTNSVYGVVPYEYFWKLREEIRVAASYVYEDGITFDANDLPQEDIRRLAPVIEEMKAERRERARERRSWASRINAHTRRVMAALEGDLEADDSSLASPGVLAAEVEAAVVRPALVLDALRAKRATDVHELLNFRVNENRVLMGGELPPLYREYVQSAVKEHLRRQLMPA